jgi:hypothetical protein
MMIVIVQSDAHITKSNAMTMMPVPEILAALRLDVNLIVFHAMITMLVPQMTVIKT